MILQIPYATKSQVSQRFSLTNRCTAPTKIRHTQHRGLFSHLGISLYFINGWENSKGQLEGGVMAVHRKSGSCLRAGPREGAGAAARVLCAQPRLPFVDSTPAACNPSFPPVFLTDYMPHGSWRRVCASHWDTATCLQHRGTQ